MGIDLLVRYPWLGFLAWAALFLADFGLTLRGATEAARVSEQVGFEGSYELNPLHAPAIDARRRLPARVGLLLVLGAALIALTWYVTETVGGLRWFLEFVVGSLVCLHVPLILRHLSNLALFRVLHRGDAVEGSIRYRRWALLRLSSVGAMLWAGVFGFVALLAWRVFFVGGILACLVMTASQARLSRA